MKKKFLFQCDFGNRLSKQNRKKCKRTKNLTNTLFFVFFSIKFIFVFTLTLTRRDSSLRFHGRCNTKYTGNVIMSHTKASTLIAPIALCTQKLSILTIRYKMKVHAITQMSINYELTFFVAYKNISFL